MKQWKSYDIEEYNLNKMYVEFLNKSINDMIQSVFIFAPSVRGDLQRYIESIDINIDTNRQAMIVFKKGCVNLDEMFEAIGGDFEVLDRFLKETQKCYLVKYKQAGSWIKDIEIIVTVR